ncbi:unnamed protein product, partial [Phaeothamnion confervicola]
AAWQDHDDATLRVDISARARLHKLRRTPDDGAMGGSELERRLRERFQAAQSAHSWADVESVAGSRRCRRRSRNSEDSDSEDGGGATADDYGAEAAASSAALLADSARMVTGRRGSGAGPRPLPKGRIDILRVKDANLTEPAKAAVRAVGFHTTKPLLLAGGWDKTLRLFQVDGVKNRKVQSVFLTDLPISQAAFTAGGDAAVLAGPRPFFYWLDLATACAVKVPRLFPALRKLERFAASPDGEWLAFAVSGSAGNGGGGGNGGLVLLLSCRTKQWAGELHIGAPTVTALCFAPDSRSLLAAGTDGQVFRFDVRSRRCVLRFYNEGGTGTTSLAVSSGERFTAVGSASGVVNLYDTAALAAMAPGRGVLRPAPTKAVMNLTTAVTEAQFSCDGQFLIVASREKRDALKLVHLPSCTVFANWPTERTPVRYPYSLALSPSGGFMAVGNDRGRVLLYRVKHYPQG